MPDKDQFTFDDDDGFPDPDLGEQNESSELDLKTVFSESEYVAETSVQDYSEPQEKGGGSSRMRILLMVLLLVVAGAAGAYYFMGLGGTSPSVPTVPVPAQKSAKSIALPPKPAQAPAVPNKAKPVAKPATVATVAVPPASKTAPVKAAPPKETAAVKKSQEVPVAKPTGNVADAKATTGAVARPETQTVAKVAKPAPATQPKAETTKAVAPSVPAPQKAAVAVPSATKLPESLKSVESTKKVVGGTYTLDAGSYLFESNRDVLVMKAKKLGYEPLVTPVDAALDMTRLRLGTFDKDKVQEVLASVRKIEPGAYSAPAGDRYVIYAGTFLQSRNVEKLSQRFVTEGFKVFPEPVQVVRTLSRVLFGSFATKEDAVVAAREATESGLKAEAVKYK